MNLTDRDLQILRLVGRFGQLSSSHINDLIFYDRSDTPCDRALLRLVGGRALARIGRPPRGGTGAGSGQYIYQLGSLGWQVIRREGRYTPHRAIHDHTLAIADAYVAIKRLERTGSVRVIGMSTEPETWQVIAGAELRPDLYVELEYVGLEKSISWWVEVDMGTERQKQLKDKMARYYHAFSYSDLETFPVVLFLVPDDDRAREVQGLVNRGLDEAQALFEVRRLDEFVSRPVDK
jgi:hypothetical protein